MNNYELHIILKSYCGVLERLIRVIRHRQFELVSLNLIKNQETLSVMLRIKSNHPLHLLLEQLRKNCDLLELKEIA